MLRKQWTSSKTLQVTQMVIITNLSTNGHLRISLSIRTKATVLLLASSCLLIACGHTLLPSMLPWIQITKSQWWPTSSMDTTPLSAWNAPICGIQLNKVISTLSKNNQSTGFWSALSSLPFSAHVFLFFAISLERREELKVLRWRRETKTVGELEDKNQPVPILTELRSEYSISEK